MRLVTAHTVKCTGLGCGYKTDTDAFIFDGESLAERGEKVYYRCPVCPSVRAIVIATL